MMISEKNWALAVLSLYSVHTFAKLSNVIRPEQFWYVLVYGNFHRGRVRFISYEKELEGSSRCLDGVLEVKVFDQRMARELRDLGE